MDGETSVIHPLSSIAPLPQFELWSVPGTQVSVIRDIETEIRPLAPLASDQPIEFVVNTAVDEYINLSESYLYVKARIKIDRTSKSDVIEKQQRAAATTSTTDQSGAAAAATINSDPHALDGSEWSHVIPVQNFMHSMFSQVDVKIGDKEITSYPQNYAFRAYVDKLLGYSTSAKRSHLITEIWGDKSTRKYFTTKGRNDDRKDKSGDWFEMMGRLHIDLAFQEKNLIGGIELRIRLIPNDPKFIFNLPEGLKAELEFGQVVLNIHKAKVYPSLVAAHHAAISSAPCRYPITRTEVRQQSIPAGQVDALLDNCIRGQIPRRMFLFLVDNETLNGAYATDPFTFKHYNLNYLAAFVDGVQYPSRAYTPDFEKGIYSREYKELFVALNQNRTDTFCDINQFEFSFESPIFAFNFSPDLTSGPGSAGHVSPIQHGSLRLHLKFERPLPYAISVLMYCEFDNIIEIDKNRQARTDYN